MKSGKPAERQKHSPDRLPGELDRRVFIGGNYDQIPRLRDIRNAVEDLGFVGIIPRDDVIVPLEEVHDWDLRILHDCRFAIFDVSVPAGEMMEIERVRDYGTQALLIYGSREQAKDGPPEHITRMIRTFRLPLKGYPDTEGLKTIVAEFLSPEHRDPDRDLYLKVFGYWFDTIAAIEEISKDGTSKETATFEKLQASGAKPVSEIEHEWTLSSGEVLEVKLEQVDGKQGRITWREEHRSDRHRDGKVIISPPLKPDDAPLSYRFTVTTRGAYSLTAEEFMRINPDEPAPLEAFERVIVYPTRTLVLGVRVFEGYEFRPAHTVMYGTFEDLDAAKPPMTSFAMDGPNLAVLTAKWPKIQHTYQIRWELPPKKAN